MAPLCIQISFIHSTSIQILCSNSIPFNYFTRFLQNGGIIKSFQYLHCDIGNITLVMVGADIVSNEAFGEKEVQEKLLKSNVISIISICILGNFSCVDYFQNYFFLELSGTSRSVGA